MAAYDSDSGSDLESFTETSTLLGYASKEATDDSFSQLGGHPTWLDNKIAPSAALAKCKICNDLMSLLLQLNGDLPSRFPSHERRLYLFGCRRKTCRRKEGSIRGIRGTRVTKSQAASNSTPPKEEKKPSAPAQNLGNQLFGGSSNLGGSNANPFFQGTSSNASANPFASASSLAAKPAQKPSEAVDSLPETFASKAKISDSNTPTDPSFIPPQTQGPPEPWPEASAFPSPYPSYHLDADYETLDKPKEPKPEQMTGTLEDTEMGGTSSSSAAEDAKLFESSMDKTFQKFADRLAQNPEQILRYEFDGQPLLYSSTDAAGKRLHQDHSSPNAKVTASSGAKGIPRCTTCGGERVSELQLTPHAITMLEEDEMSLDGMDWGTILLGVCSKDCVPSQTKDKEVGYVEEWVGVQWEELAGKGK